MSGATRAGFLITLVAASLLHAFDPVFARDPGDGLDLLGIAADDAGHHETATIPRSPWQRLPPDVQLDLAAVIQRQLDHPARKGAGRPPGTVVAASEHGARAFEEWCALGKRSPTYQASETWPPYYFDRGLGEAGRRLLLALHAKLKAENVWGRIWTFEPLNPAPTWPGFHFVPLDGPEDLRDRLTGVVASRPADLMYVQDPIADTGIAWSIRSNKVGAELHFKFHEDGNSGKISDFVEFHLDFDNPGGLLPVNPDLGDYLVGPLVSYGRRVAAHVAWDLKCWGRDDHGTRAERMDERVVAAIRKQGIPVLIVDESTYSGTTISNLVKWRTDPGWFGHLWLRPADRQAGWWTEDQGSRAFTRVDYLPEPSPLAEGPHFVLLYEGGWVDIVIQPDGRLAGLWYRRASDEEPREFEGELELGEVRPGSRP